MNVRRPRKGSGVQRLCAFFVFLVPIIRGIGGVLGWAVHLFRIDEFGGLIDEFGHYGEKVLALEALCNNQEFHIIWKSLDLT